MRYFPKEDYEFEELEKINAEDWQAELLKKNPEYNFWGNFEDYMSKDGHGWDSRYSCDNWKNFNWKLDDLNEVVNFYFEVYRESVDCEYCDRTGYNEATKRIADDFYDFSSKTGRGWSNNLTEDELEALMERRNLETRKDAIDYIKNGIGLDALDRFMLVRVRAERLGVFGDCEHCDGHGYRFVEPSARVGLQLWILHPRKGCSRGAFIEQIDKEDVPEVINYLKEAQRRNNERFSKL